MSEGITNTHHSLNNHHMPTELLLPREGLSHAWGCHVLPAAVPLRSLLNSCIPVLFLLTTAQQDSALHPSPYLQPGSPTTGEQGLGRREEDKGSSWLIRKTPPRKRGSRGHCLQGEEDNEAGLRDEIHPEVISSMGCIMQG